MVKQTQTHETQRNTRGGNTDPRVRNWFFTLNNYVDTDISFFRSLWQEERYAFQEEQGESGTPHLQGVVVFRNARTLKQLKLFHGRVHWEVCKSLRYAVDYCTKNITRSGQSYVQGLKFRPQPRDPLQGRELYPWQKHLKSILEGPIDDRKIHWVVDHAGNNGKSMFAKSYIMTHQDSMLVAGATRDSLFAISKCDYVRVIFVDVPRGGSVNYQALESVKNGLFFNSKYESGMKIMDPPHIVVLCNDHPDLTRWTGDRYEILQLESNGMFRLLPSLAFSPQGGASLEKSQISQNQLDA